MPPTIKLALALCVLVTIQLSTGFAQTTVTFDQSGTGGYPVLWTEGYLIITGGDGTVTDVLHFSNNGLPNNPNSYVGVCEGPSCSAPGNNVITRAGSDSGISYTPDYSKGEPGGYYAKSYTFNYVKKPPPAITSVTRECASTVFLAGTVATELLTVGVNWNGGPGQVVFSCSGRPLAAVQGDSSGAFYDLKLGDLTPSLGSQVLQIVAVNSEGRTSAPNKDNICVVPFPDWGLSLAPTSSGECYDTYSASYETGHWGLTLTIPDWFPLYKGKWGLEDAHFSYKGYFSTAQGGSLQAEGDLQFDFGNKTLSGKGEGSGVLSLDCQNGLTLSGSGNIGIAFGITNPFQISDIPGLASLQFNPVVGPAVAWFLQTAKVNTEFTLAGALGVTFRGAQGITTNGSFAPGGKASISAHFDIISDRLELEVSGGLEANSIYDFAADPVLQGATFGADVKVTLIVDVFSWFGINLGVNLTAEAKGVCSYTPTKGLECRNGDAQALPPLSARIAPSQVSVIKRAYRSFGDYSRFHRNAGTSSVKKRHGVARSPSVASESSLAGATLISNLFRGASPKTLSLKDGRQLLLWVADDPNLPVTQATGIMWSIQDVNGDWSSPQLIAADTRAEFSPVAAVDASGRVLAAWLRVKDPNFPTSVSSMNDVAEFYKDFEVVTSDFDSANQAWTPVTPLTDDTLMDTALQLSSDDDGNVLLTWLSNPDAELLSTADSPSSLKYSIRSAGSWSAPVTLATNLVGVSRQVAAVHDIDAFIIVARNPDITATDNGVLDLYRCTGGTWSAAEEFATGGVENRVPIATYDTYGTGHIAWQRGSDFVTATIADPTPKVVQAGSADIGFYNAQLIPAAYGELVLTFEQPTADGPAGLGTYVFNPVSQTWGQGPQLAENGAMVTSYSAYADHDNQFRLAYLSTEILTTPTTITANGVSDTINVPTDGETDLKFNTLNIASAISPIDQWRLATFGQSANNPSVAGDYASPAGDGISNLMKYALGLNPLIPSATGLPTISEMNISGMRYLTLTFNRSLMAADVTYTVQVSSDLATWNAGSSFGPNGSVPANNYTTQTADKVIGTIETISVRDNTLIGTAGRHFMRLQVSH
ncbi:MAG: hypothetical protein M3128_03400 [Verrucomicrobiota bacterium]|nr:hypothetical protein [Verrucomicrobiota bacterium]